MKLIDRRFLPICNSGSAAAQRKVVKANGCTRDLAPAGAVTRVGRLLGVGIQQCSPFDTAFTLPEQDRWHGVSVSLSGPAATNHLGAL